MKAEDLMIGDWVTFNHLYDGVNHKIMTKIVIVGGQNILTEYGQSNGDNLQPIQLTKEILEKNGFEGDVYLWFDVDNDKTLEYYPFEYRLMLKYGDESEVLFKCQCFYVHELQHALKLCRIEKDIIL